VLAPWFRRHTSGTVSSAPEVQVGLTAPAPSIWLEAGHMTQAVSRHIPCPGFRDWFRDEHMTLAGPVRALGCMPELSRKAALSPLGLLNGEDGGHGGPPWRGLPETELSARRQRQNLKRKDSW